MKAEVINLGLRHSLMKKLTLDIEGKPREELLEGALEVVAHVLFSLHLERDINDFTNGSMGPLGAWDMVRIALA